MLERILVATRIHAPRSSADMNAENKAARFLVDKFQNGIDGEVNLRATLEKMRERVSHDPLQSRRASAELARWENEGGSSHFASRYLENKDNSHHPGDPIATGSTQATTAGDASRGQRSTRPEAKATITNRIARAIIGEETATRERKTERLKAIRLKSEAEHRQEQLSLKKKKLRAKSKPKKPRKS